MGRKQKSAKRENGTLFNLSYEPTRVELIR